MNENVYWAKVRKLTNTYDYLEVAQTSKSRWSVTIDGHTYSVRTNSTDFWNILHAALKLRSKRQARLELDQSPTLNKPRLSEDQ